METEQARQVLADVEARHSDILKLEKSLKELHDLFLDMALLIESQVCFDNPIQLIYTVSLLFKLVNLWYI